MCPSCLSISAPSLLVCGTGWPSSNSQGTHQLGAAGLGRCVPSGQQHPFLQRRTQSESMDGAPGRAAGTGPFLTSVDAAGTGQTWLGTDSGNLQKFMSPFDRPKMACLLWAWLKLLYTHSSVHPFVPLSIHPTNISTHPLGTRLCSGCWVQRNRCDVPPLVFVMWFIFYILQLF